MLDSVLTAGTPSDFAVRVGYLDEIAQNKQAAVDALTRSRGAASEQRSVAAAANRRAQEAADAAQRALDRSRAAAEAAQQAADKVKALVTQREGAVQVANQERGAVLAKYHELEEESARVAAELRAAAARKPPASGAPIPPVSSGAYFTMPVSGHKTSNFGMRFHPLFHYWRLHSGMDIGAGVGSPIVAAADGEVVRAGYSGGSGNYTCIHHGSYQSKGIATCYAHQSQISCTRASRCAAASSSDASAAPATRRVPTCTSRCGSTVRRSTRRNGFPPVSVDGLTLSAAGVADNDGRDAMPREKGRKVVASNRKARHDYTILDTFEAGVALTGTEVKSLRAGRASLVDAFAEVRGREVFLLGMHIPEYAQGTWTNHEPRRTRKLLLKRIEIDRLAGKVKETGNTLVPLSVYFSDGWAKVELGSPAVSAPTTSGRTWPSATPSGEIAREAGRRGKGMR
jgi:SsrA-binding protein